MEMRATEDVSLGVDLTPPIRPLAFVLRDSALSSHCSACFSTLQSQQRFPNFAPPSNNPRHVHATHYCSEQCSSLDYTLHFSSSENQLFSLFNQSSTTTWTDSSELRLSLRLISIFQQILQKSRGLTRWQQLRKNDGALERIGGLMTNREIFFDSGEIGDDVVERIREGAKLIARATSIQVDEDKHGETVLEEAILCLVLTNAVEVHDKNGSSIGVAVYSTIFSWINHSCSPNSCYRFVWETESNDYVLSSLRIASATKNGTSNEHDSELQVSDWNVYGPRLIVRSIKAVNKGDEVTIAYTDLLQPKVHENLNLRAASLSCFAKCHGSDIEDFISFIDLVFLQDMRQDELWLKYRFLCSCSRCVEGLEAYVDHALQALTATNPDSPEPACKLETLAPTFDDVITEYLSSGDPNSSCKSLENLLIHGSLSDPPQELKEAKSLKLQPFHYLSLNAYTTLASAYKVRASETTSCELEVFSMYKTSAGYSLLLAGAAHHLFTFESSLVANTGNFFINAGESLLPLAMNLKFSHISSYKCDQCCLGGTWEPNSPNCEATMSELYRCIAMITPKIWSILSCGSRFLELIQNPIDFNWLVFPYASVIHAVDCPSSKPFYENESSELEAEECGDEVGMKIVMLGIHCLKYGLVLLSICNDLSVETNYYRIGSLNESRSKYTSFHNPKS